MAQLTPEEFLATVLVPEKQSDHMCWECRNLKPVLKTWLMRWVLLQGQVWKHLG